MTALLMTAFMANADNQMNETLNSCHFSFDADNPAHEAKEGGCIPSIVVNDDGTAKGSVTYTHSYKIVDLVHPIFPDGGLLKGANADPSVYGDDYVTQNAACNLITGNATYSTTDSNLEITTSIGADLIYHVTYSLSCRNAIQQ